LIFEKRKKIFDFSICFSRLIIMYSSSNNTLKLFNSIQPTIRKTIVRTLLNPFAPKPIEAPKDAHSNLLTDTENVFELQHHTVKPSSMVK
jgi:hypothetical protein